MVVANERIAASKRQTTEVWPVLKRQLSRTALYAALLIMSALFGLPFFWALLTSLKTPAEIFIFPPIWFPAAFQWHNYIDIWQQAPFATFLLNSCIVTLFSMIGQLLSASLVAYGFARFKFPGRNVLFLIVLSTLMLPHQITVIPTFLLYKILGWLDSFKPLIVPSFFGGGAFSIFLFRQFFLTIPQEFDEAARMDGANSLLIFFRILLPLSTPIFTTMGIFSFLGSWNAFFYPLIFLNTTEKFTLALGLRYFQRTATAGGEAREHLLMAAAMLMTLPCVILFLILQRYFVRAIVMSGIKG
jgi:ABC-type glycerol-3-phosphate transport system permease component